MTDSTAITLSLRVCVGCPLPGARGIVLAECELPVPWAFVPSVGAQITQIPGLEGHEEIRVEKVEWRVSGEVVVYASVPVQSPADLAGFVDQIQKDYPGCELVRAYTLSGPLDERV
jgi:hypothetical protein